MIAKNKSQITIQRLNEPDIPQILDVFSDAFHDYPVMKMVIGNAGEEYDDRLRLLIKLFVMKRFMRQGPILGIKSDGVLVACVTVTSPYDKADNGELKELERSIWNELGRDAQYRYKTLCDLWKNFNVDRPHYHINMIGVRSSYIGQGLGSQLIEAVHQISDNDPDSRGVTLTTEDASNLPFYQNHGYHVEAYFVFSEALETWCFFRPK